MQTTRQELYDLVWSTPLTKAAIKVGLTPTGLAKLCSRMAIPHPPRGFWRKREEARAAEQRPPLSLDRFAADEVIVIDKDRARSRLPRSRLSSTERASQMIEIGARLIRQEGLAACTITRIAEEAGVSESLAFNYCKSRDELLIAIARQELADRHLYRREQVRKGKTLEERVRLSSLSYLERASQSGSVYELLMQLPVVRDGLRGEVKAGVAGETPVTAEFVAKNSRWSADESYWKTHVLTVATQRVANLQAAGAGTHDECAKVALAMTGIVYN
ncbi:MAG: TetR/AcrR family transcriptional regulator [Alphaproteobacteria bacterium]